VSSESRIDQLEILRDTDRVDGAMWNRALPVDGGTYKITARAPGATAWSTTVTIAAERDTKTVDIPKLQSAASAATGGDEDATPNEEPPDETPLQPRSTLVPLVLGGAGLAALGGAIGFELWGRSTYEQAKTETTSQARRDSLYSSANTKRYVAEGLAIAGIGCAAVAVWLYLRGRGGESTATTSARIDLAPMAGTDRAGVAVVGRY
jgi:hypothetical protein